MSEQHHPVLAAAQPLASPALLWRHVLAVESVSWFVCEQLPPALKIRATGAMQSRGWREPFLLPRRYARDAPDDGVWEFDFYALPPADTVVQVTTPVMAALAWRDYARWRAELRGIAVVAQRNRIVRYFG